MILRSIPRSSLGVIGERLLVSKLVIHNYDNDNIHTPQTILILPFPITAASHVLPQLDQQINRAT